jgi:hypothetical protein
MKINLSQIQKGIVAAVAMLGMFANTALVSGSAVKYVADAISILTAVGVFMLHNDPTITDAADLINKVVGHQVVTVDTTVPASPVVATAASTGVLP